MDLQHIGSRFTLQANISAPFVVPGGDSGFKRGFKMVFNKHNMRSFEPKGRYHIIEHNNFSPIAHNVRR